MNDTPKDKIGGIGWSHWSLRVKIVLIVVLILLISTAVFSVSSYITLSANTAEVNGSNMAILGEEALQRSTEVIWQNAFSLEALALSPELIDSIADSQAVNNGLSEEQISALDEAWINGDPSISDLMKSIENNAASDLLRSYIRSFPKNADMFVTDLNGLVIAMTEPTGDYLQSDEDWWQASYNNGDSITYLADVEFDEGINAYAMNIATPIYTRDGEQIVGILRATVDVSVIFDTISGIQIGNTGSATLIDRQGTILYTPNSDMLLQTAPDWLLEFVQSPETWSTDYTDTQGNPALLSHTVSSADQSDQLQWTMVLEQDLAEVNQHIMKNVINNIITAGIMALLLALMGYLLAGTISKPIQNMTNLLTNISMGNLNRDVSDKERSRITRRGDEIGAMGRSLQNSEKYLYALSIIAGHIADGDLTEDFAARSDLDALGHAFVKMTNSLRQLIGDVNENADMLNSASRELAGSAEQAGNATNQIATTMQQVAQGTNQQASSVTQTAANVEKMVQAIDVVSSGAQSQAEAVNKAAMITEQIASAIEKVAGNIQSVKGNASNAAEAADEGARVVGETIEGMQTIKQKVDISASRVQEMGQRSDEIGVIIETINDIASQTNLLALNAAIEAARAGEHGKGFAVVADEVRKLAERSSEATKEIGNLVVNIQHTVSEAVQAMDSGADEVDKGVTRANAADEALKKIIQSFEEVTRLSEEAAEAALDMNVASDELVQAVDTVSAVVKENAQATEELIKGSTEVNRSIENIASVSEENSAAVEEVSASAEEMSAQVEEVTASAGSLAEMAESLENSVSQFTLPQTKLENF